MHTNALVPTLSAAFITSAISASVSVMKRLIATTGGTPNLRTFSRWRFRLSQPLATAADVLVLEVVLGDAAVHLERAHGGDDDGRRRAEAGLAALDVEELLRAEVGAEAGFGHDVVAQLERRRVASTELQPCAILANGPPWMKTGLFSSVCTRFGISASLSSTVMAPSALRSRAFTGLLSRV